MKILTNTGDKIISILVPIEFLEMDDIYSSVIFEVMKRDRKDYPNVSISHSPSSQRASKLSECFSGRQEDIQKIFPKFNWSFEQEASAIIGTILIPDDSTTGTLLREKINQIALKMSNE